MKFALIGSVILLAIAAWVNANPVADAMFIFAAFVIGGVWSKASTSE
ncbi:MAG: hypothetical protein AAGA12_03680 [Pseudomonadota bacterium]